MELESHPSGGFELMLLMVLVAVVAVALMGGLSQASRQPHRTTVGVVSSSVVSYSAPEAVAVAAEPERAATVAIVVEAVAAVPSEHAVQKHGEALVNAMHQCLESRGPYQTWKAKDDTFYNVCQIEDGTWALQAIRKERGVWFEKTIFQKGSGTWRELMEYLQRFATRFTGALP